MFTFVKTLIMNVIIGNKLKKIRKAKNMSQEEVADFLNISQSAYARMERGESTSWASHFNRICEVFEIRPEELVTRESESTISEDLSIDCVTEIPMLGIYRKLIRQYELQIEDLKTIIRYLNKDK